MSRSQEDMEKKKSTCHAELIRNYIHDKEHAIDTVKAAREIRHVVASFPEL